MIANYKKGDLVRIHGKHGPRQIIAIFTTGPTDKLVAEVRGTGKPPTRIIPVDQLRPWKAPR